MSNVMIDIETAGTRHHSAIISYGVAVFDLLTGKLSLKNISGQTGKRTACSAAEKLIRIPWSGG